MAVAGLEHVRQRHLQPGLQQRPVPGLDPPLQAEGEVLGEALELLDAPPHLPGQELGLGLEVVGDAEGQQARRPEDHLAVPCGRSRGPDEVELGGRGSGYDARERGGGWCGGDPVGAHRSRGGERSGGAGGGAGGDAGDEWRRVASGPARRRRRTGCAARAEEEVEDGRRSESARSHVRRSAYIWKRLGGVVDAANEERNSTTETTDDERRRTGASGSGSSARRSRCGGLVPGYRTLLRRTPSQAFGPPPGRPQSGAGNTRASYYSHRRALIVDRGGSGFWRRRGES
ncbi:uncharacterized protein A4U43_C03F160 [Asparagus officinalis]|uniref:Uncharacterized protein n=1 Tax=Asparagus officinalis TaxID=4686 RepID=A0A5P1F6V4_ASPOF|nr:uncharacterized protein A4U43_C03F160 [Asparagus officinalis]